MNPALILALVAAASVAGPLTLGRIARKRRRRQIAEAFEPQPILTDAQARKMLSDACAHVEMRERRSGYIPMRIGKENRIWFNEGDCMVGHFAKDDDVRQIKLTPEEIPHLAFTFPGNGMNRRARRASWSKVKRMRRESAPAPKGFA